MSAGLFFLSNFSWKTNGEGSGTALKAIIFDLDGTLINSAIPFKEMKARIIEYLEGIGVTRGLLNDGMLNFEITSRAVEDLRRKGFSPYFIKRALDQVSNIMNEVELESLDDASLIPGVPETLKALKERGLKLGLMTRSCREYAEKILKQFGLRRYFDAVIARDDVENPKPHPSHAFKLLELLNASPEEALFVGDHWSDAECAKRSGLRFVLFTRGQGELHVRNSGIRKIKRIEEVLRIVELLIRYYSFICKGVNGL
jgi:HAD superfamily hydrolase (TIGR01509 family)